MVCASAVELEGSEGGDVQGKKPALFYITTSHTTSTISTERICYITTSAAGFTLNSCKRKRKKAFISDAVDHVPEVEPSQVESGMDDTASEGRLGKFLLYWLTTTTTSITTEYTKTVTVYSVSCTPSG